MTAPLVIAGKRNTARKPVARLGVWQQPAGREGGIAESLKGIHRPIWHGRAAVAVRERARTARACADRARCEHPRPSAANLPHMPAHSAEVTREDWQPVTRSSAVSIPSTSGVISRPAVSFHCAAQHAPRQWRYCAEGWPPFFILARWAVSLQVKTFWASSADTLTGGWLRAIRPGPLSAHAGKSTRTATH